MCNCLYWSQNNVTYLHSILVILYNCNAGANESSSSDVTHTYDQSIDSGRRKQGRPPKTTMSGQTPATVGRLGVTCPVCAKPFNNSSALAKHKLTHSDERKYVCRTCSKTFKRQDHLYALKCLLLIS